MSVNLDVRSCWPVPYVNHMFLPHVTVSVDQALSKAMAVLSLSALCCCNIDMHS